MKAPVSLLLWPSGFATTTSTLPALRAGAVAVIVPGPATVTAVAVEEPNDTVAPDAKPVPVIVTIDPPLVEPDAGAMAAIAGGALTGTSNVNPPARRLLCPSGFVTTMSAAPAPWAGVVAVIVVEVATAAPEAGVPPIETVAPAVKPVPVMVTLSPPDVGPEPGEIPVTVGAAAGVG